MATKEHNPVTHCYYYLRVKRWSWARFKGVCAKNGRSMREVICDFIEEYVRANE